MLKTVLLIAVLVIVVARVVLSRLTGVLTPPSRVKLVPTRRSGRHAAEVELRRRELESLGFALIGTYRVEPMRGVIATAFSHPGQSLCAVVYGHPLAGTFVDMVCMTESDRSLTVTTAPTGGQLDQRSGHEKIFDGTLSLPAMFDLALRRRPAGPYASWNGGNFASQFETAYAREMDWRTQRGHVTRDEVRRVAEASGHKLSEEKIAAATRRIQDQYATARREGR